MARFAVAGTGIAGRAILSLFVLGPESPATRQVLLVHYPDPRDRPGNEAVDDRRPIR